MPILTHDKPDPMYYYNIIQYDDGNWAADPLPIDDYMVYPAMGGYAGSQVPGATRPPGVLRQGLRTTTGNSVASFAQTFINKYAPPDLQRNAIHTLATVPSSDPSYAPAQAMMTWIASVNSYRDTEIAHVKTLIFNQLVVYQVPTGQPPWPSPPAGLTPVPPARVGSAVHKLRFG
jgi:hypothetical protein